MKSYLYLKSEQSLWTVGFYHPNGRWEAVEDHDNEADAQSQVAKLNGGEPTTAQSEVVTLRDQFAMAVLGGIFAAGSVRLAYAEGFDKEPGRIARVAYEFADAMMTARAEVATDAK